MPGQSWLVVAVTDPDWEWPPPVCWCSQIANRISWLSQLGTVQATSRQMGAEHQCCESDFDSVWMWICASRPSAHRPLWFSVSPHSDSFRVDVTAHTPWPRSHFCAFHHTCLIFQPFWCRFLNRGEKDGFPNCVDDHPGHSCSLHCLLLRGKMSDFF